MIVDEVDEAKEIFKAGKSIYESCCINTYTGRCTDLQYLVGRRGQKGMILISL